MVSTRPLTSGVYAATMTFFDSDENLDLETLHKHIVRLSNSGCAGIVAMGSNGEAPHLSIEERNKVIQEIRSALAETGKERAPIITGCSDQSVRLTINLIREAADAGSDYALVLPPTYFKGAMSPDIIETYFKDIANQSPIPIIIYSFPGVSAGIEMDSSLILRISEHPNVIGTKFTCGDTGKLNRVVSGMKISVLRPYITFGGLADFILPALVAGATGVIAGGANVTPRTCIRVFDLYKQGKLDEAIKTQALLAQGDYEHTSRGIQGTKAALQTVFGYGGAPRRPLQSLPPTAVSDMDVGLKDLIVFEEQLAKIVPNI